MSLPNVDISIVDVVVLRVGFTLPLPSWIWSLMLYHMLFVTGLEQCMEHNLWNSAVEVSGLLTRSRAKFSACPAKVNLPPVFTLLSPLRPKTWLRLPTQVLFWRPLEMFFS